VTKPDATQEFAVRRREFIDHGTGPLELSETAEQALEITDFHAEEAVSAEIEADEVFIADESQEPRRSLIRRFFGAIGWTIRTLFGIISLILLLAIIAAVPILNFLALGYLLEVEGRVARSGRIRDAFPLLNVAPRLGSIALGVWLWVIPIRLLSSAAADARVIEAGSRADRLLHGLVNAVAVFISIHICLALARGGALSCFFRPIKNVRWLLRRWREGNYWTTATTAIAEFVDELQIQHHFVLGLKGWVGAMIWLVIPTALFAIANKTEGGPILVTIFGGFLLIAVLGWVPFLQARFAAENRFSAMFELGTIRRLFRHAPLSWFVTVLITFTLAIPMYLFKVVLPPRDAMWLITVVFIVSIYPVKVLTGWAYHRAVAREKRAHLLLRWPSWWLARAALAAYVFILFFTQFIGEHGKGVLFEHHAFLLPVPF
jgi:hypothetical protein